MIRQYVGENQEHCKLPRLFFPTLHTFLTSKEKNGIPPSPYPRSILDIHLNIDCLIQIPLELMDISSNQVARLLIVVLDFKCPYDPLDSHCPLSPKSSRSGSDSLKLCLVSSLPLQFERKLQKPGGGTLRASTELAVTGWGWSFYQRQTRPPEAWGGVGLYLWGIHRSRAFCLNCDQFVVR